jgi:hypothetical protein
VPPPQAVGPSHGALALAAVNVNASEQPYMSGGAAPRANSRTASGPMQRAAPAVQVPALAEQLAEATGPSLRAARPPLLPLQLDQALAMPPRQHEGEPVVGVIGRRYAGACDSPR